MRRVLKLFGFLCAIVVLLFVVAILALYHLLRVGEFRRFAVEEIEKQSNLKVQLSAADLEVGWISGIVFRGLTVSEVDQNEPALTAERVTARVALWPLLRREIIFYEIRVTHPTAHLVRDPSGRIALLDKLLNLPFLKQQSSEFPLDLRSIKLDGGDIELVDQTKADRVEKWRLADVRLDLDRVRGQRLREFMQQLLKRQPSVPFGIGAEFDVRGTVIKENAKMNLAGRGYLLFPREPLDFREARWYADVELVNFPAWLIKDYVLAQAPIKAMTGHLAQRVHLEGSPAQQLRLKGDIEFKQLAVDAPELFLAPLDGADGRATFEIDWSRQFLRIRHADFRANDLKFSVQGDIDWRHGSDPRLHLNLSALSASIAALRKFVPVKIIQSPQLEKTFNTIDAGQLEIKKGGIDTALAELRRLAEIRLGKQVWFEAELREVAGTLSFDGALPMRALAGRIALSNGVLTFQNIRGMYGESRLNDLDGTYDLSTTPSAKFDLVARAEVDLAELKEQLKAGWLAPQAARLAASVQELSGRSKLELAVKRSTSEPMQFNGKMTLDNARARYDEYALSDLQGELTFKPGELSGERIRAQLNGSPIQIQLALKDYDSADGSFDLGIESSGVRAGVLTTVFLPTGSLKDPGMVRGAVRYAGALQDKSRRRFTGNLDLFNVQTSIRPLLQPLRELNGRIAIDDSGIDFQNLRASLVGFPASASGRWRFVEKPQLLFDFAAPNLDITYLISQIDPESSNIYPNLVAEGKITLNKGRIKNFEFGDLTTNATIDHRVWRLTNLTGTSAGGTIQGVTTIFDKPDTLGVVSEPRIQGVPIQSFLHWFGLSTTEMTGKVTLTGRLETVGKNDRERKQNLNGAFNLRIEDGVINRMRIVVQILNLLDLSRWFTFQIPDLAKQGIRFRAVTGDFKVTNGVYSTENLIVDSSDLRMTGVGTIDVPKDEVNFVVAVRPFAGIDTVMSYIPLLGRSIAAIKNSFLVASFHLTGRIDDPTITPAPLGTLSEWFWGVLGIPKNIIGFGEGENKEPPKEPPSAPAK